METAVGETPQKNSEWNNFKVKAAIVHAWRTIKENKNRRICQIGQV